MVGVIFYSICIIVAVGLISLCVIHFVEDPYK